LIAVTSVCVWSILSSQRARVFVWALAPPFPPAVQRAPSHQCGAPRCCPVQPEHRLQHSLRRPRCASCCAFDAHLPYLSRSLDQLLSWAQLDWCPRLHTAVPGTVVVVAGGAHHHQALSLTLRCSLAEASDEELEQAASIAAIHATIAGFKKGYSTRVGARLVWHTPGRADEQSVFSLLMLHSVRCVLLTFGVCSFGDALGALQHRHNTRLAQCSTQVPGPKMRALCEWS
jgi:hypothetical protein